jgi:glycosyltransferase involved in cell wall biosynthesis
MNLKSERMRISLILPSLSMGGAEKNRVKLANMLVGKGHDVDLVVRNASGPLAEDVDGRVAVIDLQAPRVRSAVLPLFRYMRERRPDVVLAAMWPLTVVSTCVVRLSRVGARLVVSEHTTLSKTPYAAGRIRGLLLRLSVGVFYRLADAVVAVSDGVASDLCEVSLPRLPRSRVAVVYNSAGRFVHGAPLVRAVGTAAAVHGHEVRFVAVGNLKPAKDYATMLRAFKSVSERRLASLRIVGSGPLDAELEQLAEALGVSRSVSFLGFQNDPDHIISDSDILVLSSRWEGFPNVLVEALRLGKQVVSTNCRSGPGEILAGGRYGWLSPVSDVEALARNMHAAATSPIEVTTLLEGAARFSDSAFLDGYLAALRGPSDE